MSVTLGVAIAGVLLAVLANCLLVVLQHRSAPAELLARMRAVQNGFDDAARMANATAQEVGTLQGAWRAYQANLESFLDGIDSRARRISATESQRKRREEPGPPPNGSEPSPDDPESQLVALRRGQGM